MPKSTKRQREAADDLERGVDLLASSAGRNEQLDGQSSPLQFNQSYVTTAECMPLQ
jgi:hypothetical protein